MELTSSWCFWALLSAFFAALTTVFAKVGMQEVDSVAATLITTVIVLIMFVALTAFTGGWTSPLGLTSKTWTYLSLCGVTVGASWMCYFRALKMGDASKVAPVDKLSVLLVVLFAVLFLGERPAPRDWIGIVMVAAGVLCLSTRS